MSEKRDYYEILGVRRDANTNEIKRSYRKLALKFHPDQNQGDSGAEIKFKEAAEAYDVLGDEQKRSRYDRHGHAAFAAGGQAGPSFSNIEDIFSAFGDIFGGGGMFGGGRRRAGPRKGRDLKIVVDLTLEEIDSGVEKTVALKRVEHCDTCAGSGMKPGTSRKTCATCGGRGQVARNAGFFTMASTCPACRGAGETLESACGDCGGEGGTTRRSEIAIQIPAGIEEEMRLRVAGEGDAGPLGAPRGDLYCLIREKEHNIFQRSGPDVILEVPFSFPQLAMGDKVEIPTLRGKVEMAVPTGTQSGKVFRLRGQGLPRVEGHGRGDQLVRVFVEVPQKLTDRQEELLREFDDLEHEKSGELSFFERIANYFSS
ncbi:MAG: molecular chaperone DnaJ [Planctomycetota bacterium]|nr:MAG: molecular chaperone DnaJ [Planctomycetota bacterium]